MKKEQITPMIFKDDGEIPNNEALPVILYSSVFSEQTEECRRIFERHNWTNSWIGGVFDFHHYHSNAHEVLGVINGEARIKIGGREGTSFDLEKGDVIVLPAGTGHKKMSSSFEFEMVGAYPDGMDYNLKTGEPGERPDVLKDIQEVPLPDQDPVFGEDGPLIEMWHEE
ncbi:cupin domain-containing protein [Salibacterium aidingense]|uniref:cupin domain-containing protein n=1 Tax=Salibacterium aidingense TaxID=384933 RepID=UPI000403D8C8|nr:cupin domain-containing protein [Salibacterium aidingense]